MRPAAVDVLAFLGAGLLTIGAGLVFLPAAFIVCGALLLAGAVLLSRVEGEA